MSRAQRRHGAPQKKSYLGYVLLGIIVVAIVGLVVYNNTKGSGVDYSVYGYTDDVYAAPQATVLIEEFSDFQCPACQALEPTLKAVRDAYPEKVRLVYRQYPLRTQHQYAQGAAEASECAREQNKFWAYHDVLFDSKLLQPRQLKQHAEGLGLDMEKWNSCMEEGRTKSEITMSMREGNDRGVRGTPTLFVNGDEFEGRTIAEFDAIINSN